MRGSDLVSLLRAINTDEMVSLPNMVSLPKEIVDIIVGSKKETSWEYISVGEVLSYLADMIEE